MEANGRRWTRWTAVVVGASTFLAMAGIAAARLTSESANVTIAPQQNGTAAAECGPGSTAVAGGFAAPGLDPGAETGPAILTYASTRSGDGKWPASGHNFNRPAPAPKVDTGSGPLVAYSYCDTRDPRVTVRSESTTVDPGGHATLTPKCARGREAVSGGFQSDQPTSSEGFTAFAYTSMRSGDRVWKVAVANVDSANSHSVDAFAYCEKHGPDLVTRGAEEKVGHAPTVTITPSCPKGSKIFSGGYKSTFSDSGGGMDFNIAYTSKRNAGKKWKVSAIAVALNTTSTKSAETALAYCAT
jgi:hypothetical protein